MKCLAVLGSLVGVCTCRRAIILIRSQVISRHQSLLPPATSPPPVHVRLVVQDVEQVALMEGEISTHHQHAQTLPLSKELTSEKDSSSDSVAANAN